MLPYKYRLTKNKDFEKVAKHGQSVFSRELGLKWIKNNLSVSRFGIIVSLKVSKKAVIRNKLKRRLRAIIQQNLETIKTGFDIIILSNPEIKKLNFTKLKRRLEMLLKRARLIKIIP
ncbi:MAG: ribonuclease P protein component [Patescibacteria group bacterium]